MNLSTNFTLDEFIESQTASRAGILNVPDDFQLANMKIAARGMEEIRTLLGNVPVLISSGLRVPALNALIPGSSVKSDHMTGFAVDFTAPAFGAPMKIAQAVLRSAIKFDQLIYEYTWVHISFRPGNRRDVRTLKRGGGYMPGLVG